MTSEDSLRQSLVNFGGSDFEHHVRSVLNKQTELMKNNIYILDGKETFSDPSLQKKFKIPIRESKRKHFDISLVAQNLETKQPIAWIDCSTSNHGRFPLTLFYSFLYKQQMPNLKVAFVTPDVGKKKNGNETVRSTEWGSHDEPTKDRALAEKYLDGVYIDSDYLTSAYNFKTNTKIEGILKQFSDLVPDLIRWKNE
nr:BsaWI family type II restriction enzyme [uncultured Methanoregula sp.]